MPLIPRQAPGTTMYTYSTTASSSSSASQETTSSVVTTSSSSSTPSSSLYLFTFLITIVVLGLISGALLFRAYYMRRQFHRRVEEAIRQGRPIPTEAANALGMHGPLGGRRGNKKDKKVGPMPSLWEAEMWRDGEKWDGAEAYKSEVPWEGLTPLSISHYTQVEPAPAATPYLAPPPLSPTTYLRSLLSTRPITARPTLPPRQATNHSIHRLDPAYTLPTEGEDVIVGVMIAMPVEGAGEERWNLLDRDNDEDQDVPEVCLGVMSTRIGGVRE